MQEWVSIHRDTVIAYNVFSHAFDGASFCGLHLAPLGVKPAMIFNVDLLINRPVDAAYCLLSSTSLSFLASTLGVVGLDSKC